MRREGMHTEQIQQLYSLKVLDVSDIQGIEALLYQVIDEVFLYEGIDGDMAPFTASVEKGILKIKYSVNINRPDSFRRYVGTYSAIIFALMPDISGVEWSYEEIQTGGMAETKTIFYDWEMVQDKDFVDRGICQAAKRSAAKSFGASASDLQFLLNHSDYYRKGKMPPEKEPAFSLDKRKIKKEFAKLPDSYAKAAECDDIYVNEQNSILLGRQKEDRQNVWNSFYRKVRKGVAASIIIANYNSLENAAPDQRGSVYYRYLSYDGISYYLLDDFVSADGSHDYDGEVVQAEYLLEGKMENDGTSVMIYYLTDDVSVSWRDVLYSNVYSAVNEFTPACPVKAVEVVRQDGV